MKIKIPTTILFALLGVAAVSAAPMIRECFDKATQGSDSPLNGQPGANSALTDVTGIGFASGSAFLTYGTTLIREAQNFNVAPSEGLPPNAPGAWAKAQAPSGSGGIWGRSGDGSSTNNGGYDARSWSVRALATNAYIDLALPGTYWVSYRVTAGNSAMEGLGFASGTNTIETNATFIGFGITRQGIFLDDTTPADNTPYITYGTLSQGDMVYGGVGTPAGTLTGGPYYARAAGANALNTRITRGCTMLGKIVVGSGNSVTFSAKLYNSGINMTNSAVLQVTDIPYDPGTIAWDVSTNFTQTGVMRQLLFWMNTLSFSAEMDGFRVSTNYAEVVGLEIFGPTLSDKANVTSITVYEHAKVTNFAAVQFFPVDYQWTKNGTNIPGTFGTTTNNGSILTYVIGDAATTDSGAYGLVATNGYGVSVSVQANLTVLPAVAPTNGVVSPVTTTRYQGGSVLYSVTAQGSTPFTYQWTHATTNLPSATNATLTVTNLQLTGAGAYACIVGNAFGSSTSAPAALTVSVPVPGSYAEAVVANNPYAFYQLNETSTTVIADAFNGHDGAVVDTVTVPGTSLAVTVSNTAPRNLPFPGFAANNYSMGIANNPGQDPCRLNAPPLNIDTNQPLTFVAWVYSQGEAPNIAGIVAARDFAAGYALTFDGGTQVDPITGVAVHQLSYTWPLVGGTDAGAGFVSGLTVPTNEWTFVALVVETNQAVLFRGHGGSLAAATNDVATFLGVNHAGYLPDTSEANALMIGRDSGPGEAFWHGARNFRGLIDEVAVFNKTLSFTQLEQMYHAGAGDHVQVYVNRSGGNVDLSWINGELQSSPALEGPYENVGARGPNYTDSITNTVNYYRVLVGTNVPPFVPY
jgi:Concanavalin A-like lectin/glucanases superfamily